MDKIELLEVKKNGVVCEDRIAIKTNDEENPLQIMILAGRLSVFYKDKLLEVTKDGFKERPFMTK